MSPPSSIRPSDMDVLAAAAGHPDGGAVGAAGGASGCPWGGSAAAQRAGWAVSPPTASVNMSTVHERIGRDPRRVKPESGDGRAQARTAATWSRSATAPASQVRVGPGRARSVRVGDLLRLVDDVRCRPPANDWTPRTMPATGRTATPAPDDPRAAWRRAAPDDGRAASAMLSGGSGTTRARMSRICCSLMAAPGGSGRSAGRSGPGCLALDGADGDAEHLGGVDLGEVLVEPQDEDGALAAGERRESGASVSWRSSTGRRDEIRVSVSGRTSVGRSAFHLRRHQSV